MELAMINLSKTYGKAKKKALDGFTATLLPGVYGLLGPNGAGKSTLMNIITDNINPDSGKVLYNGESTLLMGENFRKILGYMPQQQGLYDDFTANRFLWYMASLKGLSKGVAQKRIEYVLDLVNLKDSAHKKLGSFSGGMKQRILIAQALLNDPKILILDEPTAGLDPKERIRIRNFISEISINKIVILATHVVSDIEYIAKEVILIKEGKLLMKNEPSDIIKQMQGKVFETTLLKENLKEFQQEYRVSNIVSEANGVSVRFVSEIKPSGFEAKAVKPSLEDIYLYLFADQM